DLAGTLQTLQNVIFGFLLKGAHALHRSSVLCGSAFVFHRGVNQYLREFVFLAGVLQVVAPDTALCLECHFVLRSKAEVAFFAVDVSRYPVSRDQVQTPAIHMEEVSITRAWSIGAVQADNVEVLVFDPDASQKASVPSAFLWRDIEHQRANITQKLSPRIAKLIVRLVKVVAIGKQHPGETERLILHLEVLRDSAQQVFLHAFVLQ